MKNKRHCSVKYILTKNVRSSGNSMFNQNISKKFISVILIALILGSIFAGTVSANMNTSSTDTNINAVLSNPLLERGNTGYEPWYYYIADMVSAANGNLYLSEKDISIKARGFNIEIIRSYNSHNNRADSPFGFGWTYNYDVKLVENSDGSVSLFDEDGSVHNFTSIGGGGYTSPNGIHSKLTKNSDDSFILLFKDGSGYNFNSNGMLLNITDKNGNKLTFNYTDGKLTNVADDSGLSLSFGYNAESRISKVTDQLGREINYEYYAGKLVKVTDAMGESSLYFYYNNDKLQSAVDRVDSTVLFSYDTEGRVEKIGKSLYNRSDDSYLDNFTMYSFVYNSGNNTTCSTDAMGHTTEIQVNALGNPITITDAIGEVTSMDWDSDMNLVNVTDANGNTAMYVYDSYGNLINQTDPTGNSTFYSWNTVDTSMDYITLLANTTNKRGFTTSYKYDVNGNLNGTVDATGNSSYFIYDTSGNIICVTDFRGYTTLSTYDTHANLLNYIDATRNVTDYTYDIAGRLLTVTDANSHTVTNVYDDNNRLIKVIDAVGNETIYEYNAVGSLISTTDANGHKISSNSNIIGKVEGITDPAGNKTSFKYDKNGNLVKYTTAKGSNTTTEYDALGRMVTVTDALGNAENYTYDAVGNLIAVKDRNDGTTTYTYDALNRLIEIRDQLGNTTNYGYDSGGNIFSIQDPNGQTTRYEYNALDRVIRITDALDNEGVFSYDANGNLLTYTDANEHSMRYEYDELNRRTKAISPLGYQTQYTYDPVGNVISKKDANENITLYEYDALDRLTLTTYLDTGKVKRDYDAVGNLIQISNIGIGLNDITQFSYDELDRLTEVTRNYGSFSRTIGYSYDKNGNLAAMQDLDGGTTVYQYDELDRLIEISDPYVEVTTYQYDKGGRRIAMERPNGVTTLYSYDAANRFHSLVNKKSSGDVISSYTYNYNNLGNRLSMKEANGDVTLYTYDALNRLVKVIYSSGYFTQFTYDALGNRMSKTNSTSSVVYTYDDENRLLTANGISYGYDNNGNLIGKSDGTNYEYDYENRLIKVTLPDTSQVMYQYSASGDRLSRTNSSGTTYYLYDLEDILMELDEDRVQQARYIHGPGIDEPISMHRGGNAFYYQFDGLGSVTSLSDVSENVIALYNYDVFGNILEETGSVVNPYKFTGREYDEKTGIYYYRARYYDAEIGRFLSKDPVWNQLDLQNSNRYLYVRNNPINKVDPFGLLAITGTVIRVWGVFFVGGVRERSKGILVAYIDYEVAKQNYQRTAETEKLKKLGTTILTYCDISTEKVIFNIYKDFIKKGVLERLKGIRKAYIDYEIAKQNQNYSNPYYDPDYPYGYGADPGSYNQSDWPYWYSDYSFYSYGGTDVTSIEDWHHFIILVDPEKIEYKPGETAQVTIDVLNKNERETIWLGVSFEDPTGKSAEYDPQITITPQSATINQNEIKTFTAEWTIPDDAPLGTYRIAVNAWKDDTFTEKYTDDLEWVSIFKVVPVEDFSRGYADNDFYYLTSYSAPGAINVYDRDTLKLHTTISLPNPRSMDSHGDLFVSTFKEACYPDGPTYSWSGIAVYDKADNFNCLKKTNLRWDVYHDYSTSQPMIDDNYLMLALAGGGGYVDKIAVYDSAPPFANITSINIPGGDLNDAAHDNKYVGIATAWSGYHQYVFEKGTWNLVADIVGPYNGGPMAFYHGGHDYLFIGYSYKQGRAAEYIKYDYHNLNGPYVKKVVTSEFEVIQDIIACPPYILISGWNIGETELLLQVRDAQTDAVVANFEPTFDGWIQWLDYYLEYLSPLTITAACPVDLIITDPDGLTIDKQSTEIPGATYIVTDLNGDGDLDDRIIIPNRKKGDYQIAVIPEHGAENSDTYTLDVSTVNTSIVLAENVQISDIPDQTYTVESAETGITISYNISLSKGWNLISIPLMPEDTGIASVLFPIHGNYSIVWAYNASDTADHWKKYDPSAPFGNDLINIEPGKGYWIMMISDDTLPIIGTVPESTDINLKTGWNLIGYNSLDNQPIAEALSSISGNYTIVWAYDASDTADHWKKYDPGAPFGNDLTDMEPVKGYWIMMTSADILET